jgi:hypothetical protein
MTCEIVRETMCEYLDDLLEDKQKQNIENHLASCESCSREAEELRQTIAWVKQAEDVTPPPRLRQAVLAELGRESRKHRRFAPGFSQAVAAAAVFVLLVAGNVLPSQQARTSYDAAPMGILETDLLAPMDDSDVEMGILTEGENTDGEVGRALEKEAAEDRGVLLNGTNRPRIALPGNYRLVLNLTLIPLFFLLSARNEITYI